MHKQQQLLLLLLLLMTTTVSATSTATFIILRFTIPNYIKLRSRFLIMSIAFAFFACVELTFASLLSLTSSQVSEVLNPSTIKPQKPKPISRDSKP